MDAWLIGAGIFISQSRPTIEAYCNPLGTFSLVEVPIAYVPFAFSATWKLHATYKKELYTIVKFVSKYEYSSKHSFNTSVVPTDHRHLIYFSKSDTHEGIHGQ